jgi:hypothetical protein
MAMPPSVENKNMQAYVRGQMAGKKKAAAKIAGKQAAAEAEGPVPAEARPAPPMRAAKA